MFTIAEKRGLGEGLTLMRIHAPFVARNARAGQFIIFRVDELGERIPLTIADADPKTGLVTIIFQQVGGSTIKLGAKQAGDTILDFVGPLGVASHLDGYKRVCIIGGGVGCAIAYPQAKYLHQNGCQVDLIAGFRNRDLLFFEREMSDACTDLHVMTDDGSYGEKGLVTDKLNALINAGAQFDAVIAIGPVIMMKFVCLATKPYGIKTIVSLNPIMVDGTGMCGACRVTVGGKTRFACVDGPDFDGHEVDFDELMRRNTLYKSQEAASKEHICNILKEGERLG